MKNDMFSKKLKSYSLLAGSLITIKFSADAQIVYTNVAPDDTLHICDTLSLDLNNDGIVEFRLGVNEGFFGYWNGCAILKQADSAFFAGMATGSNSTSSGGYTTAYNMKLAYKLNYMDPINANVNWVRPRNFELSWVCFNTPDYTYSQAWFNVIFWITSNYKGLWAENFEDGYLGMKFKVGNDDYYGWARLVVDTMAAWMVLKDYAYNSTPNGPIAAGQCYCQQTVVEDVNAFSFTIFPNPAASTIFISGLNESFENSGVSIFDLSGRKLLTQSISSTQDEIDVSSLSEGIYFLEVKNEDRVLVKKFEVKKR